jgi:hypothetical protein
MPTDTITNRALAQQLLDALDALSGLHPGFRPAHAKGLMCRHVLAVALRGRADPCPAREPAVHARDRAILEFHRRADDP